MSRLAGWLSVGRERRDAAGPNTFMAQLENIISFYSEHISPKLQISFKTKQDFSQKFEYTARIAF